jgi:hypothetical protein
MSKKKSSDPQNRIEVHTVEFQCIFAIAGKMSDNLGITFHQITNK